MKTKEPKRNSGKTHFNRIKKKGQSWTKLREDARKAGQIPTQLVTPAPQTVAEHIEDILK